MKMTTKVFILFYIISVFLLNTDSQCTKSSKYSSLINEIFFMVGYLLKEIL